ncbi:MAG: hypothetical protein KC419_12495 [Anaerolineales bacterium]|nr:hypothetical protein [Anaerolineales bacterium]MCA9929299.1 hypothetical protein [Anaerolineales bacterium]
MKQVPVTLNYLVSENTPLPHPVLVSRQIDGLREVLRRMRAAKSTSLDPIINKKLQQLAHR